MRKISFFLLFLISPTLLIQKVSLSQNGWTQIQSPTSAWLQDVQAVNQNSIYAAGLGYTVIKSIDTGNTWFIQYSGANNYNFYSSGFINQNTGYVCGGYEQPSPPYTHNGLIVKTTNGGINWAEIYSGGGETLKLIYAVDTMKAFSCGFFTTLMTTNGGLTWFSISAIHAVTSFCFLNQYTGFATNSSTLSKTTDGGYNWTNSNLGQGSLLKVIFTNLNTGYVLVSNSNKIIKTTNGGLSWLSPITIPDLAYSNSMFCINSDTLFIAGSFQPTFYYGRIIRSSDGGQTWITQYAGIGSYTMPYSISFLNNLTGFAVGPTGLILKTTTGGEGFNAVYNHNYEYPQTFELSQNFPNPFNPETNISFTIPTLSKVVMIIYDVSGMEIKTLVNETKEAGNYSLQFDGTQCASGVYFYCMHAGGFTEVKKMVLLK